MNARYSVPAICVLAFLAAFPGFGQTYQETFEHARSLPKQHQFAEALDQARLAVKLDSTRWEGWFAAGTAAIGLEKTDLAIDYFQEALSRAPDAAKPTVNNAIAACRQVLASKSQPPPPPSSSPPRPAPPPAISQSSPPLSVGVGVPVGGPFGSYCYGTLFFDGRILSLTLDPKSAAAAKCKKIALTAPRDQVAAYGSNTFPKGGQNRFHVTLKDKQNFSFDWADKASVYALFSALDSTDPNGRTR
jgi:hypothetical protein